MPKVKKRTPIVRDKQPPATSNKSKGANTPKSGNDEKLKAQGGVQKKRKAEKRQTSHGHGHGDQQGQQRPAKFTGLQHCMNIVDRQAASAIKSLIEADAGKARGARWATGSPAPVCGRSPHIRCAPTPTRACTCPLTLMPAKNILHPLLNHSASSTAPPPPPQTPHITHQLRCGRAPSRRFPACLPSTQATAPTHIQEQCRHMLAVWCGGVCFALQHQDPHPGPPYPGPPGHLRGHLPGHEV